MSSRGTLIKSRKDTLTNTTSRSAFSLYFHSDPASALLMVSYLSRYEDRVVQDNFKFGDDKEIVRLGSNSAVHAKAAKVVLQR